VPLREWIAQDRTRREIQRKFRHFMETFTEDDDDDLDENNEELMEDGILKPPKRKNALYEMRI